jgi:lipoprotein-releasing system permease protein
MGMTGPQIGRIFMAQGLVVGVVGTALGLGGGLLLGNILERFRVIPLNASVYFIDHLPVDMAPFDVAAIVTTSLVIALLATVFPSRRAAALDPVEAIRHE